MPELNRMHKDAFRTAYELLDEMWPPINSPEFVVTMVKRGNERLNAAQQDPLTHGLINAVINYLDEEIIKMGGLR